MQQPKLIRPEAELAVVVGCSAQAPHLHPAFEITILRRGRMTVETADGRYGLAPGELFIAFPGSVHACAAEPGSEAAVLTFADRMLAPSESVWAELRPAQPQIRLDEVDPDVRHCLERLEELARTGQPDERLARAYLSLLFLRLMPLVRPERPVLPAKKRLLYQAMRYLAANLARPLTLQGVAHALGVNPYYLSHVLNAHLRLGFRAYLNGLRVDRARQLLLSTADPIEVVGAACGFSSLRSFDRVFAQRCGCTPRAFRRKALGAPGEG